MKLGFVSAILDGWSFEEMIDTARDLGFSCVEAACCPPQAERRYAGVSHIDVDGLTDEKAAYILGYCKERRGALLPGLLPQHHGRGSGEAGGQYRPPEKGHPGQREAGRGHGHHLRGPGHPQDRGGKPGAVPGDLAPIVAFCRGTPRQGEKLSRTAPWVRRHQLARQPEPLHPPTSGAGVLEILPAPTSHQLRSQLLHLAADGLHPPCTSSRTASSTSTTGHRSTPEAGPGGRHGLPLQAYGSPSCPAWATWAGPSASPPLTDIG